MRPSALLDPADRLRLEAAVVEAERSTAGEIVVAVVHACHGYGSAGWRLGVLLGVAAFLGLAIFVPNAPPLTLLAAQAAGLGLGHGLGRIDPVRRRLIADRVAEARAQQRARRAFAETGLTRTQGRTGILIFVALLERRVIVLADDGIDRLCDPDERWDEVVELALRGLRNGRALDGLVAAVDRCGEILAHHHPTAPRNVDELPNAIVLED